MSRTLVYSLVFLGLSVFETSFFASWPDVFRLIPLVPVVAIWLYHQRHSRIGIWFLLAWGIWHDFFQLSLWSIRTLTAVILIAILVYASGRIFSHQSIYGLLGLGVTLWLGWGLTEALFRFFSATPLEVAFDAFVAGQLIRLLWLLLGLSALFGFQLRLRRQRL